MSIPFSNTHYRIPRGFANLLEGLTREVLREQPQDIPHFAAKYFAELLKKREESGFDPAEWGAALEDRYYNNHSFKDPEDKTFTVPTHDVNIGNVQLSQDFTSSVRESKEEHKLIEDSIVPAHTEDISDRRESSSVPDNSEDTLEPQHHPSSSQLVEEDHKEPEEATSNLLQEQSATVIQAAFRGHQAREGVRKLKEESGEKVDETATDHAEDLEPESARTLLEDSTPLPAPQSNILDAASTEDIFGEKNLLDEDLEDQAVQTQGLLDIEMKGDSLENSIIKDEAEDHVEQQITGEGDKADNLAVKEDVGIHDVLETSTEVKPKEENSHNNEDMETQDMSQTQDHKEDKQDNLDNLAKEDYEEDQTNLALEDDGKDQANLAMEDDEKDHDKQDNLAMEDDDKQENLTIEDDGKDHDVYIEEKAMMESHGSEAAEDPSIIDEPDTSVIQETQRHENNATDGQQESETNKDTESEEQVKEKGEELADSTTTVPVEHYEDREDPNEENEALRKQTEEALDIALDDPDANAAAAKIQAGFRGHMTRKKMKSGDKEVKHKEGKEGSSAQGEHEGD